MTYRIKLDVLDMNGVDDGLPRPVLDFQVLWYPDVYIVRCLANSIENEIIIQRQILETLELFPWNLKERKKSRRL